MRNTCLEKLYPTHLVILTFYYTTLKCKKVRRCNFLLETQETKMHCFTSDIVTCMHNTVNIAKHNTPYFAPSLQKYINQIFKNLSCFQKFQVRETKINVTDSKVCQQK